MAGIVRLHFQSYQLVAQPVLLIRSSEGGMEILYLAISLLVVLILPRILSHYLFADRGDEDRKPQQKDAVMGEASTTTLHQSPPLVAPEVEENQQTDSSDKATQQFVEPSRVIQDQSAESATDSPPQSGVDAPTSKASSVQTPNTIVNNFNNQSNNNWRCACEGGFLPPGMLQSLGGAEAAFRMSTGQCYHKKEF